MGYPRRGDPQSPGAPQSRPDAAPHGHPGVRAGARGRQRHPAPSAGVQGLQRRLRRRPDGRPLAAVDRSPGRSPHADDEHAQHLQPGQRCADHQPVARRGDGLLLPDDERARGQGRRHGLLVAGRSGDGLRRRQGAHARQDQGAPAEEPLHARRSGSEDRLRQNRRHDGRPRDLQHGPAQGHAVLQHRRCGRRSWPA